MMFKMFQHLAESESPAIATFTGVMDTLLRLSEIHRESRRSFRGGDSETGFE